MSTNVKHWQIINTDWSTSSYYCKWWYSLKYNEIEIENYNTKWEQSRWKVPFMGCETDVDVMNL